MVQKHCVAGDVGSVQTAVLAVTRDVAEIGGHLDRLVRPGKEVPVPTFTALAINGSGAVVKDKK